MKRAFMRRCAVLGILALGASGSATAQSPGDWFTKNPRIRAAYFHVLFLQAENFPTNESNATQRALQSLIRTLNNDIDDFTDNDKNFKELEIARYSSAVVKNLGDIRDSLTALGKI